MTISASTVAPMAIAIPPRLMIVDGISSRYMGMNASATLMGKLRIGSRALRRCSKNKMITMLTTTASSMSACVKVLIERSMRSERSYAISSLTPSGKDA